MRGLMRDVWARGRTTVLLMAVLLAAADCGGGDTAGGKVKLRFVWWGNEDRAKVTEQAIALFERKHPDIDVETSFSGFDAYFQKLATEVAGGNAPDVLQMDYRYLREYADRNVLLDLNSQVGKNLRVDDLAEAVVDSGVVDGKRYAVPLGQNTQVFVYDIEKWRAAGVAQPKPGWTWQDYQQAAQRLTAASGGKVSGTTDFGREEDWFEVWLRQQGKQLFTADGELGFGREDLKAFWELAGRFRQSRASTPPHVTTQADGSIENSPVGRNLATSEFGYDSSINAYFDTLGKPVGLAPFPSSGGPLGQYAKPSMLISIAKRSKHPAEAAQLIDFLVNDEEAGEILGTSRGLPPNVKVRDAVARSLRGAAKAVFEYEKRMESRLDPTPPAPPKGDGALKRLFPRLNDDVSFGRISVDEAVERFFAEADKSLS